MTFQYDDDQKHILIGLNNDSQNITIEKSVVEIRNQILNGKTTKFIDFEEGSSLTTIVENCFKDSSIVKGKEQEPSFSLLVCRHLK